MVPALVEELEYILDLNRDGVQWPLAQPQSLRDSAWFGLLSQREQEAMMHRK